MHNLHTRTLILLYYSQQQQQQYVDMDKYYTPALYPLNKIMHHEQYYSRYSLVVYFVGSLIYLCYAQYNTLASILIYLLNTVRPSTTTTTTTTSNSTCVQSGKLICIITRYRVIHALTQNDFLQRTVQNQYSSLRFSDSSSNVLILSTHPPIKPSFDHIFFSNWQEISHSSEKRTGREKQLESSIDLSFYSNYIPS